MHPWAVRDPMHFHQWNRRQFIALLGGAAAAWPVAARAQQSAKRPIVGFLGDSTPLAESERAAAFARRLHDLGWIEGRTVAGRRAAASATPKSPPSSFGS